MTDLEISKALALAIGWEKDDCLEISPTAKLKVWWREGWDVGWRVFDYRDWSVIGPIAERYDCFPKHLEYVSGDKKWCAQNKIGGGMDWMADTPQKAIALAVIEGAKK